MKFRVTMKDPDTLDDAIKEAIGLEMPDDLDDEEMSALEEVRFRKVKDVTARWFKWGEYLTVEIDTETKTCVVVPEKS